MEYQRQRLGLSYRVMIGLLLLMSNSIWAQTGDTVELVRSGSDYSQARLRTVSYAGQQGLAVEFTGTHDLHYYAIPEAVIMEGFELTLTPIAEGVGFGDPVLPAWTLFYDEAQKKNVEVYVGDFTVFLPFTSLPTTPVDVTVTVSALTCTSQACLPPFDIPLTLTVQPSTAEWPPLTLTARHTPDPVAKETSIPSISAPQLLWYLLLAVGAGLSINIMPCVLPVIPLVIMKLLEQSKQAGKQRLLAGFTFCAGIVAFFAVFAAVTAVIQLATGKGINPNDLYRYPSIVIALFLGIVFFGLVMLDIMPIALPNTVAGTQTSASSLLGSLSMGFFAGVLSIPCSGALLGAVLVWAQTQPLVISSLVFLLMGIGMALPYAILISIPSLMERIPKPGTWMEYFKKGCGFLLFFIAAKLTLAALPKERLINVLLYGVVLSFAVWMWGQWVNFSTPTTQKRTIRLAAMTLAILGGFWLLPDKSSPSGPTLDWQHYDAALVRQAQASQQPVLLKFTADWCSNCKVVEKRVYRDADIIEQLQDLQVLAIKADTTSKDMPATQDLTEIYGEAGNIPVTILLLPNQAPYKLRGIDIKEQLQEYLKTLSSAPTL